MSGAHGGGVLAALGLAPDAQLLARDASGRHVAKPAAEALGTPGCVVGVYFSAHWCPPCRAFTPQLAATYKTLKAAGQQFEVVFVSCDRSPGEFGEYVKLQPWLAVPFESSGLRAALQRKFAVAGIPALIILDPTGRVLAHNARAAVAADPAGAKFPWAGASSAGGGGMSQQMLLLIMFVLAWVLSRWFTSDKV